MQIPFIDAHAKTKSKMQFDLVTMAKLETKKIITKKKELEIKEPETKEPTPKVREEGLEKI